MLLARCAAKSSCSCSSTGDWENGRAWREKKTNKKNEMKLAQARKRKRKVKVCVNVRTYVPRKLQWDRTTGWTAAAEHTSDGNSKNRKAEAVPRVMGLLTFTADKTTV